MAKIKKTNLQNYPRIENEENHFHGYFDESKVTPHKTVISDAELKDIIKRAVIIANVKSSRAILNIKESISEEEINKIYIKQGIALFRYFLKYCGDPASSAFDCVNQHYRIIAKEQFRNRTIQKERMNSGWRYQFIAKDTAILSKRFHSISDLGTSEADFNAIILELDTGRHINIYTSVKNRTNTMGGQDWPKAIIAMESMAQNDKNRSGPYLCVFGIAMEKGQRRIKNEAKTGKPYSYNTEIWLSEFFWRFFSNISYERIIKAVLDILIEEKTLSSLNTEVPEKLIASFGKECSKYGLVDKKGIFNDPYKLVDLFCGKIKL
ncbi:MAG: hypothetical protein ABI172_01475 [Ginsengibacter sp.]